MTQLDLFTDEQQPTTTVVSKRKPRRVPQYKKVAENVLRLPSRTSRNLSIEPNTQRTVYFHTRLFRAFRLRAVSEILARPLIDQDLVRKEWIRAFRAEMSSMGFSSDAVDRQAANFMHLVDEELGHQVMCLLSDRRSGGAA